jgi:hypothetical protein
MSNKFRPIGTLLIQSSSGLTDHDFNEQNILLRFSPIHNENIHEYKEHFFWSHVVCSYKI